MSEFWKEFRVTELIWKTIYPNANACTNFYLMRSVTEWSMGDEERGYMGMRKQRNIRNAAYRLNGEVALAA